MNTPAMSRPGEAPPAQRADDTIKRSVIARVIRGPADVPADPPRGVVGAEVAHEDGACESDREDAETPIRGVGTVPGDVHGKPQHEPRTEAGGACGGTGEVAHLPRAAVVVRASQAGAADGVPSSTGQVDEPERARADTSRNVTETAEEVTWRACMLRHVSGDSGQLFARVHASP